MKRFIGIMLVSLMLLSLMMTGAMAAETIVLSSNPAEIFYNCSAIWGGSPEMINDGNTEANNAIYLYGTSTAETWIAYDFGAPCRLTEVVVIQGMYNNDGTNAYIIEASNNRDFTDAVELTKFNGYPFENSNQNTITITDSNKYQYLRMRSNSSKYFVVGEITVKGESPMPDNAELKNLVHGSSPFKYSPVNGNITLLTDGVTTGDASIGDYYVYFQNADDTGYKYASFDLKCVQNVYEIEVGFPAYYSLYSTKIYGSNNINNMFEKQIATVPDFTSSESDRVHKITFSIPKQYRYITVGWDGTGRRLTEFKVNGAVTTTLKDQTYDILAGNILKADDGSIVATTGVTNIRGTETVTCPVFVLAVYGGSDDAETLVAATSYTAEPIEAGDAVRFDDEITIPASNLNGKTYTKAKLFVFDNTTNLTPICKPLTVSIAN